MLRVTPVENPDSQRGVGRMEEDLEARAKGDGRMEEDLEAEAKGDGPEKEGKAGEVSDDERGMERELGCVCADRMRRLMKMGFSRRQADAALRSQRSRASPHRYESTRHAYGPHQRGSQSLRD